MNSTSFLDSSKKRMESVSIKGSMQESLWRSPRWQLKKIVTLISISTKLDKDINGKDVDLKLYRSIIGSILYVDSKPDIIFSIFLCLRFQVSPKDSHLHAEKKLLDMLKALQTMVYFILGILVLIYWDIVMRTLPEAKMIRKVQVKTCHFLGHSLVSWFSKKRICVVLSTIETGVYFCRIMLCTNFMDVTDFAWIWSPIWYY